MGGIGQGVAEEETLPFPQKREGECKKMGRFRRKVHKFLQCVLMNGKIETFSSKKRFYFETKDLSLPMIKHNLPFSPPPAAAAAPRGFGGCIHAFNASAL